MIESRLKIKNKIAPKYFAIAKLKTFHYIEHGVSGSQAK